MFGSAVAMAAASVEPVKRTDRMGLIVGVTVIALGLGGAALYQRGRSGTRLPARPSKAAVADLAMLGTAGEWSQRGRTQYAEGNRSAEFTAKEHVYWSLGGRWQITETRYLAAGRSDHELSIKTFNQADGAHQYVLCTDTGHVVGFRGRWMEIDKALQWEPVYPATNSPPLSVFVREIIPQPDRRRVMSQYRHFTNLVKEVLMDSAWKASLPVDAPLPSGRPAGPEWAVLGDAGLWGERQKLKDSRGATAEMRVRGRARWACEGRCLLFEGVILESSEGERQVPVLWIKTFEKETGAYRYAYFWENGQVDHYQGRWDEKSRTLSWRSTRLDSGEQRTCEFEERSPKQGTREWKYKLREFGKVIVEGAGEGRRLDEP